MQGTRADRRREIIFNVIIPILIALSLLLFDQITKTICKNNFENNGWKRTEIISGFFYFEYTMNTGAAWSFLANWEYAQLFFKILTCVFILGFGTFYIYVCTKSNSKWLRYTCIIILMGTIGNFIDRLAYNGVVDFISFYFGKYHFPIFNIADMCMCVGVVMLIINYLFLDKNALFKKNADKKVSN